LPQDQPPAGRVAPPGAGQLTPPPGPSPGRIARNTVFSAIGESSILPLFLLYFLAARYLAPVAFGQYSAAFAFVGLFRLLPDFGMSYATTLAISRDRSLAARLIGNLLGFQAVLSVLTLLLCLGIGRWLYEGPTWTAVLVLSLDLILKSIKATLRWLLKGFEMFGAESLSLLAERTVILILGWASLHAGYGVVGFVLVFALVRLFDAAALYGYVYTRVIPVRPVADLRLWGELFRKGLPFAYAGAVILMFFQVDAVMLEKMRGAQELGWYSAPVRVLEGLTLVPRILGYALIPTMAALHLGPREAVSRLYRRGLKYLLLVGLPIGAFGALASGPFISFLFGPDYEPSGGMARILLPAAAFMFLSNFNETTLACVNRWGTIVLTATLALALNVGLNLFWIPRYGGLGASWATVVTEATYFAMTALALFAYGYRAFWPSLLVRPVLAAGTFAVVLWLLRGWPLLLSAAAASAAFVLATFMIGVWDETEKDLLRRFLVPRPRP
jgi:O-antigen/teichoic acid export membrane protein